MCTPGDRPRGADPVRDPSAGRHPGADHDREGIALVYEALVRIAPSRGAGVARAAAVGELRGPEAGYALLSRLEPASVAAFQPYWAAAAHLLGRLGRREEARRAYERAMALCTDEATRAFLADRARRLEG